MDFQESNDIILYQEAVACLEILAQKIANFEKCDLMIINGFYQRCESILATLLTRELNTNFKMSLEQLLCTFQWQKTILNINDDAMTSDNNTSLAVSTLSIPSKDPETNSKPAASSCSDGGAAARREIVIGTIVCNKELSLKDVAGLESAKQTLKEAVVIPLCFPHLFLGTLKPWTQILLYGPPGTGKSRLGQAIAGEIESTFFSVSSSDLLSSYFGESEKIIKELFCYAGQLAGCSVVFIDEIDSVCRKRSSNEEEHTRRVKTELLKQMDGCNPGASTVFILCATNCPWELDVAFLRRFQRRIYIQLPDRLTRLKILQLHTAKNAVNFSDSDWNFILDNTEGFSGSDLGTLATNAMFQPIRELQSTTCWAPTHDDCFQPASCQTGQTVYFRLDELPSIKVTPRETNISDFVGALNTVSRTVKPEELAKYEEFTKQYGQLG